MRWLRVSEFGRTIEPARLSVPSSDTFPLGTRAPPTTRTVELTERRMQIVAVARTVATGFDDAFKDEMLLARFDTSAESAVAPSALLRGAVKRTFPVAVATI